MGCRAGIECYLLDASGFGLSSGYSKALEKWAGGWSMTDLETDQYRGRRSRINKGASRLPSGVLPVFFRGVSFQLPGNCFRFTFQLSSGFFRDSVFLNIRQKQTKNTVKMMNEPGMQRLWSGGSGTVIGIHIHIYIYICACENTHTHISTDTYMHTCKLPLRQRPT